MASVLGLALSISANACGAPPSNPSTVGSSSTTGRTLPLDATLRFGSARIELEVARTAQEQATGLMGRTDLPADRGMLFPFTPPAPTAMWMKDTRIPLDLVFVRDGIVTKVVDSAPPCTADPCPIWSSDGPVDAVVELRSGRAAALGITPGRTIDITVR